MKSSRITERVYSRHPEGKIGKAILAGMKALVGSGGGGSAAASAIE